MRSARTITASLLILCACSAVAEGPGFTYPGATPIERREQSDTWYVLALGSITRSGGEWGPATTERFRGDLLRLTYQLPEGHAQREAHEFYLERLQPMIRRQLFDCTGRGCGGSNHWANRIFEVKELYGPDGSQRYTALDLSVDGRPVIAAIYSIERANRRSYIHIDWLRREVDQQKAIEPAELLRAGEPVTVHRVNEGWDTAVLSDVAAMLKREPDIQLYVVGHAYEGATLDSTLKASTEYASQVARLLQREGVAGDRLQVHGVGPLAPDDDAVPRVVLIRH